MPNQNNDANRLRHLFKDGQMCNETFFTSDLCSQLMPRSTIFQSCFSVILGQSHHFLGTSTMRYFKYLASGLHKGGLFPNADISL